MKTDQIAVQSKRVADYDRSKYLTYGGVDVAEVEVDVEIGRIHVKRVLSVHDCGRPMNPASNDQPDQWRYFAGHLLHAF